MSSASVTKAKKYLVNRVMEQAKQDGISLSEIEIRMLGFSEATASAKDMEAAAIFERNCNDEEYEAKITALLKSAYQQDKKSGQEEAWNSALAELADEDIYLDVMLKQAGISGSNVFSKWLDWRLIRDYGQPASLLRWES